MSKARGPGQEDVAPATRADTLDGPKAMEFEPLSACHDRADPEDTQGPGRVGRHQGCKGRRQKRGADRRQRTPESPSHAPGLDSSRCVDGIESEESDACRDGHSA